jgi:hypothetical protein
VWTLVCGAHYGASDRIPPTASGRRVQGSECRFRVVTCRPSRGLDRRLPAFSALSCAVVDALLSRPSHRSVASRTCFGALRQVLPTGPSRKWRAAPRLTASTPSCGG